ncbi:MAG: hypothetical protein QG670_2174 [Thermoproteota archaeon]|nr:hypothetical protein [Thermoproteota archaeon]
MKIKVDVKLVILEVLFATGIFTIIYGGYNLLLLIQSIFNYLTEGLGFIEAVNSNVDFIFNIVAVIGSGLAQLVTAYLLGETFGKKTEQNKGK